MGSDPSHRARMSASDLSRNESIKNMFKHMYVGPNSVYTLHVSHLQAKCKNGIIKQKRKRENFKLASKCVEKAQLEIERRFGNRQNYDSQTLNSLIQDI